MFNLTMTTLKINYKDYPEYMFAMIASYLPSREGDDLRRVAGKVVFRHRDNNGNTYKNGVLHSYDDLPASVVNGVHTWYLDGKIHRDGDLPAVINGTKQAWYQNGRLHREGDQPAFIDGDDYKLWYKHGCLHREGDQPAEIYIDGAKCWYKNGVLHREGDLPALIDGEYREWWCRGERIKIMVEK